MTFRLISGAEIEVGGSLVVIALAITVALVRPWSVRQRALVVYALAIGLGTGLSNLEFSQGGAPQSFLWVIVYVNYAIATAATVALGVTFVPQGYAKRRLLWRIGPHLVLLFAVMIWYSITTLRSLENARAAYESFGLIWTPWMSIGVIVMPALLLVSFASCVLIATQAERGSDSETREAALVSTALVVYSAVFGATFAANFRTDLIGYAWIAAALWLAVLWLHIASESASPRAARNAALIPLAGVLAGLVFAFAGVPGAAGVSRFLTVGVLAYAILRHRALGIDTKLRFGISKGTIAAIFIAVFFIASEGAQQFFGEIAGSQYVGILAAGALVFAISPLQRLADRVAVKAVPLAPTARAEDTLVAGREARYQEVARRLLTDGDLSRSDERILAHLADDMGIAAGRAFELRESVIARGAEAEVDA